MVHLQLALDTLVVVLEPAQLDVEVGNVVGSVAELRLEAGGGSVDGLLDIEKVLDNQLLDLPTLDGKGLTILAVGNGSCGDLGEGEFV